MRTDNKTRRKMKKPKLYAVCELIDLEAWKYVSPDDILENVYVFEAQNELAARKAYTLRSFANAISKNRTSWIMIDMFNGLCAMTYDDEESIIDLLGEKDANIVLDIMEKYGRDKLAEGKVSYDGDLTAEEKSKLHTLRDKSLYELYAYGLNLMVIPVRGVITHQKTISLRDEYKFY